SRTVFGPPPRPEPVCNPFQVSGETLGIGPRVAAGAGMAVPFAGGVSPLQGVVDQSLEDLHLLLGVPDVPHDPQIRNLRRQPPAQKAAAGDAPLQRDAPAARAPRRR